MKKSIILLYSMFLTTILVSCMVKVYEIVIDLDNDTDNIVYEVENNKYLSKLDIPFKDNYKFIGQYEKESDHKFDFTASIIKDLVLITKFRQRTNLENIRYAYNYHLEATNFRVESLDGATAKDSLATQEGKSYKDRVNDNIEIFNASYSLFANKGMLITGTLLNLNVEVGSSNDKFRLSNLNSLGYMSNDEIIDKYGTGINTLNYNLNDDIIINNEVTLISDNTYTIQLDLIKSVTNYAKNITIMNPKTIKPNTLSFKDIKLTITLDDLGRFKNIVYLEKYYMELDIFLVGKQNIELNLTENYIYR